MADEEPSPHPFVGYNKALGVPTLVGNWQEERALKDNTGFWRTSTLVKNGGETELGASIYATRENPSDLPTHPRVIEHLEQTVPTDWKSVHTASYVDPKKKQTLVDYKQTSNLGPRARMELEALRAAAADLPPEVEATLTGRTFPPETSTTYLDSFVDQGPPQGPLGARVMKDRDGRPAVRDPTFLAETQLVPRPLGDRVFGEAAKSAGATQTMLLPNPDVPVTIYSEAVATRKYGSNIYGTRPIAGAPSAFNKYTNFSKPMSEYNKVVVDE